MYNDYKPIHRNIPTSKNRALSVIFYKDTEITTIDLHNKAKLASLELRADKQLLCLTYRRLAKREQFSMVDQTTSITRSMTKFFDHFQEWKDTRIFPFTREHPFGTSYIDSYKHFKCKVTEWLLTPNHIFTWQPWVCDNSEAFVEGLANFPITLDWSWWWLTLCRI